MTQGLPTCGVGYPHVIGGIAANTFPKMVDMHADSGWVAVSGDSCDDAVFNGQQLRPCSLTFVAMYGGQFMLLTWLTSINNNQFGLQLSFSPDGTYLAVYATGTNKARSILLLESSTGLIKLAIIYNSMPLSLNNRVRQIFLGKKPTVAGTYTLFGHIKDFSTGSLLFSLSIMTNPSFSILKGFEKRSYDTSST